MRANDAGIFSVADSWASSVNRTFSLARKWACSSKWRSELIRICDVIMGFSWLSNTSADVTPRLTPRWKNGDTTCVCTPTREPLAVVDETVAPWREWSPGSSGSLNARLSSKKSLYRQLLSPRPAACRAAIVRSSSVDSVGWCESNQPEWWSRVYPLRHQQLRFVPLRSLLSTSTEA
jgi:hypothetical protein